MKANQLIVPILTGVLFAAAANAQVDITITGSTAARKIIYDRAAVLFDAVPTTHGGALAFANSANQITAVGTMSNAVPSLGTTPVTLRFGMSGSAQGCEDLDQQNQIGTLDPITGNVSNTLPDIAFSDNFPESCSPPIPSSHFTANTNLLVIPMVFSKSPVSPGMSTVTNLTKEMVLMLMTSSGTLPNGTNAMPSTFLGGTDPNPVYLIGRDIGSGTRITVFKDIVFTGTPRQWATNGGGGLVLASTLAGVPGSGVNLDQFDNPLDGYSSGSSVAKAVVSITAFNCIGYTGEPDGQTVGTNFWLSYEGIPCTHSNVAAGYYGIWGYEHTWMLASASDANKTAVFNALNGAIADPTYQTTNTIFNQNAVQLNQMKVKRGVDGGGYTTTPLAGF